MGDDLTRRLDRITLLLGAILGVQTATLLVLAAATGVSIVALASASVIALVVVGLLVALLGGALTEANPFGGTDRPRGR
ncbi:hypothetical protein [Saliphagus infecundisoli]|uniref:Major facilitator superfamily (MFS) profile domain-containing protein n=1 Tax=Saliphagus infecundisoli TaxID=1849069 RepID=A0ABD5QER0_9EURY|nr:hypothetical protein [Saliphagus infecundisoli]